MNLEAYSVKHSNLVFQIGRALEQADDQQELVREIERRLGNADLDLPDLPLEEVPLALLGVLEPYLNPDQMSLDLGDDPEAALLEFVSSVLP